MVHTKLNEIDINKICLFIDQQQINASSNTFSHSHIL